MLKFMVKVLETKRDSGEFHCHLTALIYYFLSSVFSLAFFNPFLQTVDLDEMAGNKSLRQDLHSLHF